MNIIVITAAHDMSATQREGTRRESTGSRSAVLRYLLVRPNVEETRGFVLTSRGERVAAGMELSDEGKVIPLYLGQF